MGDISESVKEGKVTQRPADEHRILGTATMELLVIGGAGHAGFSLGKRRKNLAGNVNHPGTSTVGKTREGYLPHAFVSAAFKYGARLKTCTLTYLYFITSPFTAPRILTPSKTCCSSIEWALRWPRQRRGAFAAYADN